MYCKFCHPSLPSSHTVQETIFHYPHSVTFALLYYTPEGRSNQTSAKPGLGGSRLLPETSGSGFVPVLPPKKNFWFQVQFVKTTDSSSGYQCSFFFHFFHIEILAKFNKKISKINRSCTRIRKNSNLFPNFFVEK
jgi:hypothetical protein